MELKPVQVYYKHGIDAVLDFVKEVDPLIIKKLKDNNTISGTIPCDNNEEIYYKIFKNNTGEFLLTFSDNKNALDQAKEDVNFI